MREDTLAYSITLLLLIMMTAFYKCSLLNCIKFLNVSNLLKICPEWVLSAVQDLHASADIITQVFLLYLVNK